MPENPIVGKGQCPYCKMKWPIRREKGGSGRLYMTCPPNAGGCYYVQKAPPKLQSVEKFTDYVGPWDTLANVSEGATHKGAQQVADSPNTLANVSGEETHKEAQQAPEAASSPDTLSDRKGAFRVPQFI